MLTLTLKILIVVLLATIFVQDIKYRAIHWILFPVLILAFISLDRITYLSFSVIAERALVNTAFLVVQLMLVTAYFSIKSHRLINITENLLGWGDILLLLAMVFLFGLVTYVIFYVGSMLLTLLGWQIIRRSPGQNTTHIPLAGLQALILLLFLFTTWLCKLPFADDYWFLNLLAQWN